MSILPEREAELKLVLKMAGKSHKLNVAEEVSINSSDINKELTQQPGRFAFYAVLAARADDIHGRKKAALKEKYAELYRSKRKLLERSGERVTESMLEAAIETDESYKECVKEVADAKLTSDILSACTEALRQRKDMLISLATNLRAELQSDVSILKDKYREQRTNKTR